MLAPKDLHLSNLTVSEVLNVNKLNVKKIQIAQSLYSEDVPIELKLLADSEATILSNSSVYKPTDKQVVLKFVIRIPVQPSSIVELVQMDSLIAPKIPVTGTTFYHDTTTSSDPPIVLPGSFQIMESGIIKFILGDKTKQGDFPVHILYSTE